MSRMPEGARRPNWKQADQHRARSMAQTWPRCLIVPSSASLETAYFDQKPGNVKLKTLPSPGTLLYLDIAAESFPQSSGQWLSPGHVPQPA